MPDLNWNKNYWDGHYDWEKAGEEWSKAWGSSEAQWFGSIYPRIHRFLPAMRILEIAPGYGRWTKFLLQYAGEKYDGVDLANECVEHCRQFFKESTNATFHVNDGKSLDMLEDDNYDLVFSFDSLVHAELDVHEVYIPQILRKLNKNGTAFIHHSNWAASNETNPNTHCRGETVSSEAFADIVLQNGGNVIIQECLNWGTNALIDAFTLFSNTTNSSDATFPRVTNHDFMKEAEIIRNIQNHYSNV